MIRPAQETTGLELRLEGYGVWSIWIAKIMIGMRIGSTRTGLVGVDSKVIAMAMGGGAIMLDVETTKLGR